MSARRELQDELIMLLNNKGIDIQEVKDSIYIVLDKYEVQERTTEIALVQEDRNEYLIKNS